MTNRPHDALFKGVFGDPIHAGELMRTILPESVSRVLCWDTLRPEPGSLIDPQLDDHHTDLLFSARLDGSQDRAFLYLLFEHLSTVDRDVLLRLNGYVLYICKQLRRQGISGRLPLIIPMVVTHAQGGWDAPLSYDALFNPDPTTIPGLAQFVPRWTLLLEDLSHASNEQLKRKAIAAFPTLALWLLRDARDAPTLFANLAEWVAVFREALLTPNGVEATGLLLRYVSLVCDHRYDEFREKLLVRLPEAQEVVMTIAEELRQEGRQEGLQEGRRLALCQTLERMLVRRFEHLPPQHRERLEAATEDELDLYLDRILEAETIAEVFDGPPSS